MILTIRTAWTHSTNTNSRTYICQEISINSSELCAAAVMTLLYTVSFTVDTYSSKHQFRKIPEYKFIYSKLFIYGTLL